MKKNVILILNFIRVYNVIHIPRCAKKKKNRIKSDYFKFK